MFLILSGDVDTNNSEVDFVHERYSHSLLYLVRSILKQWPVLINVLSPFEHLSLIIPEENLIDELYSLKFQVV